MGYRIEYGQTVKKETISEFSKFRNKKSVAYTAVIIVTTMMLLLCFRSEKIRSFLLPGDPAVTEQALNTFTEQIRAGEQFRDAATAFCHEIIAGADLT